MWIPLLTAVIFQGLGSMMTLSLPETLPVTSPQPYRAVSGGASNLAGTTDTDVRPPAKEGWKRWIQRTSAPFGFVTRDAAVAALVLTFLISKVGRQSNNILFQYVSKKYGWDLSQACA